MLTMAFALSVHEDCREGSVGHQTSTCVATDDESSSEAH